MSNRDINIFSLLQKQTDDDFSDNDSAIETEESLQFGNYADASTKNRAPAHDLSGISLNVLNDNNKVWISKHSFG